MNIKRVILYISSFILIFGAFLSFSKFDAHAEDASVILGFDPMEVKVGDTVNVLVTINGEDLGNFTINLQYTTGILQYQSEAGDTGSITISNTGPTTMSYRFTAVGQGQAAISTSGSEVYNSAGQQITIAHSSAPIQVNSAETVETQDGEIKIGDKVYTIANEYNHIAQPEGYELTYVTYNDTDIFACQAPNHKIKLVCLQDEEWKQQWFMYDEKSGKFSPYIQYSLDGVIYSVINKPSDVELPEGFKETSLTLDEMQFTAYEDGSDSGLLLVYAINQSGNMGFYYYDTDENSFIRYEAVKSIVGTASVSDASKENVSETEKEKSEPKYATPLIADEEEETVAPEEEGMLSRETLKKLLYMMVVMFIIMCVVVIILVIRNGSLQNQLYGDEDDYDEDDDLDIVGRAKRDADDKSEAELSQGKSKISRNKSYAVNEDTGEILIEEAKDNNAGVNVPPAEDKKTSKIEKAMDEKPYGIDSAFDVADPENAPEGDHVYVEKEKKDKVNIKDSDIDEARKEVHKKVTAQEEERQAKNSEAAEQKESLKKSEAAEQKEPVKKEPEKKEPEKKEPEKKDSDKKEPEKKDKKEKEISKSKKKRRGGRRNKNKQKDEVLPEETTVVNEQDASNDNAKAEEQSSEWVEIQPKKESKKEPKKNKNKVVLPGQNKEEE
ncbi:MAG: hypothetical protein K6F55_00080 [Eubacterium sp.]|nr:hypothetical protein [Eubacterium sp.]